jgi:hypothetical protein
VVAFHETAGDPPAGLSERLAGANRDWDELLLRLYALAAPAGDRVTLALFAEHRGHLAELAQAYRAAATAHGLTVEVVRYDLPGENESSVPPPPAPASAADVGLARPPESGADPQTAELHTPKTVWVQDRLYLTAPAKMLLKRAAVAPAQVQAYAGERTVGLALSIGGVGAHLRFWGEAGFHEIRTAAPRNGADPNVAVRVSGDTLGAYRPPEDCVRRGWYGVEAPRRRYDLTKGEFFDAALELWRLVPGGLADAVAEALAANVRARLLKLVVE